MGAAKTKAKIEIYTAVLCSYCTSVKCLLKKKGVIFKEIDVTFHGARRQEMQTRSKRITVPQIFIDGGQLAVVMNCTH